MDENDKLEKHNYNYEIVALTIQLVTDQKSLYGSY